MSYKLPFSIAMLVSQRVAQGTKWAIFNSYVRNYQRVRTGLWFCAFLATWPLGFGMSPVFVAILMGDRTRREGTPQVLLGPVIFVGYGYNVGPPR